MGNGFRYSLGKRTPKQGSIAHKGSTQPHLIHRMWIYSAATATNHGHLANDGQYAIANGRIDTGHTGLHVA
jgi:hypothetical protein